MASRRNQVFSRVGDGNTAAADFAWYDRLDPAVRIALQQCIGNMSSYQASLLLATNGVPYVVKSIQNNELNELMHFAFMYERRYGEPYPHTNAFASIQRYGRIMPKLRNQPYRHIRLLRRLGYWQE